jgi:hypothetical protein
MSLIGEINLRSTKRSEKFRTHTIVIQRLCDRILRPNPEPSPRVERLTTGEVDCRRARCGGHGNV